MTLFIPSNLTKWTFPGNYIGCKWHDWFVFLGRNRDSSILENSNFEQGLAAVKEASHQGRTLDDQDNEATVQVVSENHWAVGWVEWIAIHESDAAALEVADRIAGALSDYPVLNDQDLSEREWEAYGEAWENYGARDFIRALSISDLAQDLLDDHREEVKAFYESAITSGEYYIPESDGVSLQTDRAAKAITRNQVAQLLWQLRKL